MRRDVNSRCCLASTLGRYCPGQRAGRTTYPAPERPNARRRLAWRGTRNALGARRQLRPRCILPPPKMPVLLTSNDLLLLEAALRSLLSPLDFPTLDDWRAAVVRG